MTVAINSYCLRAVISIKNLQRMEFFFVTLQTVVELVFTGLLSTIYTGSAVLYAYNIFCRDSASISYEAAIYYKYTLSLREQKLFENLFGKIQIVKRLKIESNF